MFSRFTSWFRDCLNQCDPETIHDVTLFLFGLSGIVMLICVVLFLSGCTPPAREQVFDNSGPTTKQVWHGTATKSPLLADAVGWNPGGSAGAAAWTRSAENELATLFPELRNPRLHLYVFPHLTAAGHPVPGYTTSFYLFESSRNFALPGEAYRQGVLQ